MLDSGFKGFVDFLKNEYHQIIISDYEDFITNPNVSEIQSIDSHIYEEIIDILERNKIDFEVKGFLKEAAFLGIDFYAGNKTTIDLSDWYCYIVLMHNLYFPVHEMVEISEQSRMIMDDYVTMTLFGERYGQNSISELKPIEVLFLYMVLVISEKFCVISKLYDKNKQSYKNLKWLRFNLYKKCPEAFDFINTVFFKRQSFRY